MKQYLPEQESVMNLRQKTARILGSLRIFRPAAIKSGVVSIKSGLNHFLLIIRQQIEKIIAGAKADRREYNRVMFLSVTGLCFFAYIMLCILTEKNVLNIFPPVPVIKENRIINVYMPSEKCTEIIREQRRVFSDLEDEKLVHRIFYLVAAGSQYENTMSNVPARFIIKMIWIIDNEDCDGKTCLIDLMPVMIEKETAVVKGSEQMFREALEKTVVENVPGVKKVILLEKGVPGKRLWDI